MLTLSWALSSTLMLLSEEVMSGPKSTLPAEEDEELLCPSNRHPRACWPCCSMQQRAAACPRLGQAMDSLRQHQHWTLPVGNSLGRSSVPCPWYWHEPWGLHYVAVEPHRPPGHLPHLMRNVSSTSPSYTTCEHSAVT